MATILEELVEATKVEQKTGEANQAFLKRLHTKVDALPDEVWQGLDNETQLWVNAATTAIASKKALPTLEGLADEAEEAEEEDEVTATETVGTTAPKAKKVKAKSAKVEKVAKPVKAAKAKVNGRGRPGISADAKIKLLAKENPFRESSQNHKVFEMYKPGLTVGDFEKACAKKGWGTTPKMYLAYHAGKGLISVG